MRKGRRRTDRQRDRPGGPMRIRPPGTGHWSDSWWRCRSSRLVAVDSLLINLWHTQSSLQFTYNSCIVKLGSCIVLNLHNTVFARSGPLYATGVSLGPPESSTQMASRSLQPFLQGSLGDRPTDRPTDHATRSVTVGGAHSGEAKFCYCLRLQQVFIGAVD